MDTENLNELILSLSDSIFNIISFIISPEETSPSLLSAAYLCYIFS